MCRDVAKVVFSLPILMDGILNGWHYARRVSLASYRAGAPSDLYTSIYRATEHPNERGLCFWIRHGMLRANGSTMVVVLIEGRNHVRTLIRDP